MLHENISSGTGQIRKETIKLFLLRKLFFFLWIRFLDFLLRLIEDIRSFLADQIKIVRDLSSIS